MTVGKWTAAALQKIYFLTARRSGRLSGLAGGNYACAYRMATSQRELGPCFADGTGTSDAQSGARKCATAPCGRWGRERNDGKHRRVCQAAGALYADAGNRMGEDARRRRNDYFGKQAANCARCGWPRLPGEVVPGAEEWQRGIANDDGADRRPECAHVLQLFFRRR